ncbi:RpiB/LacA/LacB family sugar-phosphate isomerase [Acutalibacter caecimuris]|uniref:RpiB/LacA/LacB family sugar-phosphate isomerase n=1 Tax=Acutalibacter caecimuris TaxID=3093657 RepID=UPI002AC9C04B|nr:RpiB/LacA/LacB family sugar-phosphate isomerase [Acutalibacter sp. M00118]
MKVAVIQASSQKEKNPLLFQCTQKAAGRGHTVVNFGVFPEESADYTYVETAALVGLLLSSGAADFVVTGCSSGQGMMLACNSLPGVLCGYVPTPQDAFLFGRINGGNAASLPLGLGFGWCGELNLQYTLDKLFDGPLGGGYPPEDAARKRRDTRLLKELNRLTKRAPADCLGAYPPALVKKLSGRVCVMAYIRANGAAWAQALVEKWQQGLKQEALE